MKKVGFSFTAIMVLMAVSLLSGCKTSIKEKESELSTYYFIRHAEKDRSDSTERDPELTEIGLKRARLWAGYFDTIPLDHIYSTDYKRTRQTVMFVSTHTQLPVQIYDPDTLLSDFFRSLTEGRSTLICGHSNTTPMLVNKLIGKESYPQMEDSDNSSLYVVTIGDGKFSVEIRSITLPEDEP